MSPLTGRVLYLLFITDISEAAEKAILCLVADC